MISTLSANQTSKLLSLGSLLQVNAVTVMVVNLFYDDPALLSLRGFGYLIPRSVPVQQNPHRALGVVFDSESSFGQDSSSGTKLTVMLGGHWWDEFDSYPDEDEGAWMAKEVLKQHLGVTKEPSAIRVSLQKDCIPQYEVGHESRMARVSFELLSEFSGRVRVAGSSYTGVGINDCIRSGWDITKGLVRGTAWTGLECFEGGGRQYTWVHPSTLMHVP